MLQECDCAGLFGMRRVQSLNGGEMGARLKDWEVITQSGI